MATVLLSPAAISALLLWGSPAAVAGLVVAVVVDAIDGMSRRRSLAHVRDEGGERLPSLTDANAPAAVPLVVRSLRVLASVFHGRPHTILGAGLAAREVTVNAVRLGAPPRPVTATGDDPAAGHVVDVDLLRRATLAPKLAVPVPVARAARAALQGEHPKRCSNRNEVARHPVNLTRVWSLAY